MQRKKKNLTKKNKKKARKIILPNFVHNVPRKKIKGKKTNRYSANRQSLLVFLPTYGRN